MNQVVSKPWLLPKQQAVLELRQRLWAMGYRPVAVYGLEARGSSPGKRPSGEDWTGRARRNPPEAANVPPKNDALNTGILCDGLRAVDIDIDNAETADAVARLATDILGSAPIRFRSNSPRRLILYRAAEGEPPKRAVLGAKGKVEILGRGQQFVAFGIHESSVEYCWNPPNFIDIHASNLNAVAEQHVDEFLRQSAMLLGAVPLKPLAVPDRERAYATAALSENFAELVSKGEGSGRNNALNAIAYRMGRMIGAGWIDHQSVEVALIEACHRNGYAAKRGAKAVHATIASGIGGGIAAPHEPLSSAPITEGVLDFVKQGQERFGLPSADTAKSSSILTPPPFSGHVAIVQRVSDVESEPIQWFWQSRIAFGKITMIAGDPGLGKSQLTAFLIARITTGTPWPNGEKGPAVGSAVMLSCEDDIADTIRPRLEAAGADLLRVHVMQAVRTEKGAIRGLSLISDIQHLERFLDEHPDVRLVVIDPITAYLDKADTHKTADVRAAMMPLQTMASNRKIAVVVVSHLNKSGGNGKSINAVTGSGAFVALARAAFLVTKGQEDEGLRLFVQAKNNIASAPGLSFRIQAKTLSNGIEAPYVVFEEGTVNVTADEAIGDGAPQRDHSQIDAAKQFLTEELRHGPVPTKMLFERAAEQRISEKTLRRAQKDLGVMAKKSAKFQGEWVWEFPFVAGDLETVMANLSPAKMANSTKDDRKNEGASLVTHDHLWEKGVRKD